MHATKPASKLRADPPQDLKAKSQAADDELRRRLRADANGAAADNMRIEPAGFEDACDFKEVGRWSICVL
jgi:hypothetical protein